jgi:hypothetical protein
MQIKMENRRAIGTLGFVALVAVLTVSMLAVNLTSQPAVADHIASNKGGGYYGQLSVGIMTTDETVMDDAHLASFQIKSSDKGDWLVDMAMECAIANQVESKGKKDNLAGAKSSAHAYIVVDGIVQDNIVWNVCSQDLQLKTQLNDLIDACTTEQAEAGLCQEGFPVFTCQFLTDEELEGTECEQSIEVYLETAGSYNVKWFLMNLDAGVHDIEIRASLQAERTSGGFNLDEENIPLDSEQKIISAVFIDQGLVYAEPIHILNDDYLD